MLIAILFFTYQTISQDDLYTKCIAQYNNCLRIRPEINRNQCLQDYFNCMNYEK